MCACCYFQLCWLPAQYYCFAPEIKKLRDYDIRLVNNISLRFAQRQFKSIEEMDDEHFRLSRENQFFVNVKFGLGAIVYSIIAIFLSFFGFRLPVSNTMAEWGQMGDFFGGMLNPILAFASFIALLYTIRIQSEELRLTTKELANNVDVQKDIVEQHKTNLAQSKANNKVSFVAAILNSKIKETEQVLLQLEGDKTSYAVIPNLWSMYLSALGAAYVENQRIGEKRYKNCIDVKLLFQQAIFNKHHSYSNSFEHSLTVLQRVLGHLKLLFTTACRRSGY